MSRIRTVKPELFESETLARLSRDSRLTFIGLFTLADDLGRLRYLPKKIAGELFPHDEDVTHVEIDKWVAELESVDCVRLYEIDGKTYLYLPEWKKHQKIDRPSQSRIPEPLATPSRDSRETLAPGSRNSEVGIRNSDLLLLRAQPTDPSTTAPEPAAKAAPKRSRKKSQTEFPDDFTLTDDMRTWPTAQAAIEAGVSLETEFEKFKNYHIAKGNTFADWRAAFRTWLTNAVEFSRKRGSTFRAEPPSRFDELRAIWEAEEAKEQVVEANVVEIESGEEIGELA